MCHLSWLGRGSLVQTFDELDELEVEREIKEIRTLLDEGDKGELTL